MNAKPVELLRAVLADIYMSPGVLKMPSVRAAYDFLETLDEPSPVVAPTGMVEAIANDCAVGLLREAAPHINDADVKARVLRALDAIDGKH